MRVGHDGAGAFAGWHLDKILIQRFPSKKSKRQKAKNKLRRRTPDPKGKRRMSKRADSDYSEESDFDDREDLKGRRLERRDSRYHDFDEYEEELTGTKGSKVKRKGSLRKLGRNAEDKTQQRAKSKRGSKAANEEVDEYPTDDDMETPEQLTEDYWFICKRWLARDEDDGKIVRELLATDEHGKPLEGGLEGKQTILNKAFMLIYFCNC